MFVVIFTHIRPLAEVDPHREAHFAYIDRCYAEGVYLLSGRREPRNGAVIIAGGVEREALEAILAQDPFITSSVARYDIFEFLPGRATPALHFLLPSAPTATGGSA